MQKDKEAHRVLGDKNQRYIDNYQNLIDGVAVRWLEGDTPSVAAKGSPGMLEAAEVSLQ